MHKMVEYPMNAILRQWFIFLDTSCFWFDMIGWFTYVKIIKFLMRCPIIPIHHSCSASWSFPPAISASDTRSRPATSPWAWAYGKRFLPWNTEEHLPPNKEHIFIYLYIYKYISWTWGIKNVIRECFNIIPFMGSLSGYCMMMIRYCCTIVCQKIYVFLAYDAFLSCWFEIWELFLMLITFIIETVMIISLYDDHMGQNPTIA